MKNYKILRIYTATPYQKIFSQFYVDNNLDTLTYEQAVRELCKNGYIIPGRWVDYMRKLGNDAIDVVPDLFPLQKKWADENGIAMDASWQKSLLYKQIEKVKPDVVFFYAGGWTLMPVEVRRELKSRYPFIKVITGLWGDPLPPNENYSKFLDVDVLFCAYEHNIRSAGELGIRSVLLGNCFDAAFADLLSQEKSQPKHDFIFAGSSGYGFPDHVNRYTGIIQLIKETDLKIWCYEPTINKKYIARDFIRDSLTNTISKLPKSWLDQLANTFKNPNYFTKQLDKWVNNILGSKYENRTLRLIQEASKSPEERYGRYKWDLSRKPIKKLFPNQCFAPLFGIDYFKLLRDSKIVFNRHSGEALHAGNIRMYEVTGMGSCLITDNPNECKRLYKLDEEIVTYTSIDECVEKVKYLLQNEEKRKEIAEKGRKRTLKDHCLTNRCAVIHESLQSLL
ncbi:MAG TPA: glycosyltransferase [Chlamydiales bacterium]|nr:glycosyltransferase [Chlamydiales bacterium]